jgi:cytochrome P450
MPSTALVDLSALAFWEQSPAERERGYAVLREQDPVSRQRPPETAMINDAELLTPYWAVVRYADVRTVSRDSETFCSGQGVMLEAVDETLLEASQSFLAMDAPRHTKVRGLVNAAFTPRQVARIESQIGARAKQIVDELAPLGECDFVERVASRLPMMTISDMIGVPESMRDEVTTTANNLVGWNDPDILAGRPPEELLFEGVTLLTAAALEMADERSQSPTDDLMSALVHTEVDGERLTEAEIGAFFVLLSVAGNDTTRHTTSHALRALTEYPEQRKLLLEDLDGRIATAIEEFVRWASPVMTFRRTATRDTKLGEQQIAAGEKVVMFYHSANRDPEAFDEPERFDVLRHPNHHAGFGGGGPHYCLGASLARTQLRSIIGELLRRLPDIEAGEPEVLVGNFINGIKRMPCRFTATSGP